MNTHFRQSALVEAVRIQSNRIRQCILAGCMASACFLGCGHVSSREPSNHRGFVHRELKTTLGGNSKYVVFVPKNYDSQDRWPTILFLHGAGQVGADGMQPIRGGLAQAIRDRDESFPFIVIFPQSARGSWLAESSDGKRALEILDRVEKDFRVDRDRVYLTGYSMGGEGTWSLAGNHPERWAAILPICPGKNLTVVDKLAEIPCWCFQGDADSIALVQSTRSMVQAIQKRGGHPSYQEWPGLEHNCWDATYRQSETFEWLLEHSKKR